jgi:hypothetical protein
MRTATKHVPQKAKFEVKSTSDSMCERLINLRNLLVTAEGELSEIQAEYDVTLVQYLRTIFNPAVNCRVTTVQHL